MFPLIMAIVGIGTFALAVKSYQEGKANQTPSTSPIVILTAGITANVRIGSLLTLPSPPNSAWASVPKSSDSSVLLWNGLGFQAMSAGTATLTGEYISLNTIFADQTDVELPGEISTTIKVS